MLIIHFIAVACLGLVLGSFATAIAHRELASVKWWGCEDESKRSACVVCGKQLECLDLVPFFSWLCLRGKCRHCNAPLSPSYPLTELLCAAASILAYYAFGFSYEFVLALFAVPFMAALILTDIRQMILPNRLVLILAIIGTAKLFLDMIFSDGPDPVLIFMTGILGAVLYIAVAFVLGRFVSGLLKKDALGMGDIKFFGVVGLWLGPESLADFCILSGALGVVLALLWRFFKKEAVFPFGPSLIISFYALFLVGGSLFV